MPETVSYYRDFQVTVEEVFRFDPEDTLVFRVRFDNTAGQRSRLPAAAAGRAGRCERLLCVSISDASASCRPRRPRTGYFAITGSPRGGRANFSIKNRFGIIVPRVERESKAGRDRVAMKLWAFHQIAGWGTLFCLSYWQWGADT